MSLPHAILTALIEEDLTGYALAKQFDVSLGFFWQASHQQIYRELKRLHTQGQIAVQEVSQMGKPDKRVYSLTNAGRKALEDWVLAPTPRRNSKDELFIKLYNMGSVPVESMLSAIAQRRQQHESRLALYRKIERRSYANPPALSAHKKGVYLSLLAGIRQEETGLTWCDDALILLRG
jgi:DNA-binding PadR family transcriptional regulator